MASRIRARLTYANVTASVALFAALGGGAYAAIGGIPDSAGVFHGCVNNANGGLRVVKSSRSCRGVKKHKGKIVFPGESAIAWNQQGRNGTNGTNGINGTNGAAGTARAYGHVTSIGTLIQAKNATLASHTTGSGIYCITPAAGIDPATTVLVATPDFAGDTSTFGTNTNQAVVEWSSSPSPCGAGQMQVRTAHRAQSGSSPVNSVDITASDEAFSFVIP